MAGGIAVMALLAGVVLWRQPVTDRGMMMLVMYGVVALIFLYRLCRVGSRV